MKAVEAKHLSFIYEGADKPSLVDVDLTINEGEFVILTGPSGCGKTTLCRCMNGLIPHFYRGQLKGMMTNPENQLFSLTVERDLAFGPENLGLPRKVTRKRVEWIIDKFGLETIRNRPPYELSGGQQQKVAIASILTMQPKIIALDEPTSFLDPKSAKDLLSLISVLNKELRMTIVLVEHRLDLASRYVDRVIVMDSGKIVASGPPGQVYSENSRLLGVGVPKISILFNRLRSLGVNVDRNPVSVDEAYNCLKAVISND
jgi:energy-coupling factor transporter ATP-binding protein EcfA2